jgi:hypothetical protein
MPYYIVPGSQSAVSGSYKTNAQVNATGTNKRGKIYELIMGTTGNPNSGDTYLQWDVSRITSTGAGSYTTFTPNPVDSSDGAAVNVAGVNATAEATIITGNSSLFNEGMNQRNSIRWLANQESQYLVWPATAGNGLILRTLSGIYTSASSGQISFME